MVNWSGEGYFAGNYDSISTIYILKQFAWRYILPITRELDKMMRIIPLGIIETDKPS